MAADRKSTLTGLDGGGRLRIVQAIASVENPAAGTTYCVDRLARALGDAGHDVELLSTGPAAATVAGNLRSEVAAIDFPRLPIAARLRFSRGFRAALDRAASQGAILHSNGLWLMPNIYPSWAAQRHGVPLVISPHGMLAPAALQFSRGRKRVFDTAVQRRALQAASCFHATSRQELEEIRAYGLDAPVAVIPNGIDLPRDYGPLPAAGLTQRTVLFLGRLHPIKGLDRLLRAWAEVERTRPDWRLRLVGPSHGGHRAELEALAQSLGITRVSFEEGLYGPDKEIALRSAEVVVLPSLNENFAMVVAEALAAGVPVIATRGTPWQGLAENGCGWWIEHGMEPLAAAIAQASAMPREELRTMGARGREWMSREFSWPHIAGEVLTVYRWLRGQGDRPPCVAAS